MKNINIKKVLKMLGITVCFLILGYILSMLEIPLMNNQIIIRFTYIASMLYASYFNVWWCVGFAIVSDIIPFLISPPSYAFFPGYTMSAVLSIMLYRYFVYRADTRYSDYLLCRLCTNTLINMLLGALWIYALYPQGNFVNYFGVSLLKNLTLAPLEALCIYVINLLINKMDHSIIHKILGE